MPQNKIYFILSLLYLVYVIGGKFLLKQEKCISQNTSEKCKGYSSSSKGCN
jgi:hypothetical protein